MVRSASLDAIVIAINGYFLSNEDKESMKCLKPNSRITKAK